MIGGMGSIVGALLAALVLGMTRSYGSIGFPMFTEGMRLSFARNWVLSLLQAQDPRGKSWLTVAAGSRPLAYVSSQSNGTRPRNTKAGIAGQPLPGFPDQPPTGFVGCVKTSPGLRGATGARIWRWPGLTARRWVAEWDLAPVVMRQPCPVRLAPLHDEGLAKHMKEPGQSQRGAE